MIGRRGREDGVCREGCVQRRFGADRAAGRGNDLGAESLMTSGAEM